jgi:hypothetical protein
MVIYVPMRIPVKTSSQSNSYPYFAPTLELINKLPGPNTTQAVIRAGPSDRHHGGRRPGFEATDDSDIKSSFLIEH